MESPVHKFKEGPGVIVVDGNGFTVIVYVTGTALHPAAVALSVIVEVTIVLPAFVAVKEGIVPVPLAPRPIDVLLFDHETVADPGTTTGVTELTV